MQTFGEKFNIYMDRKIQLRVLKEKEKEKDQIL